MEIHCEARHAYWLSRTIGQSYSNQNLHLLKGYKDLEPSASGDHHTIPEFSLIKETITLEECFS